MQSYSSEDSDCLERQGMPFLATYDLVPDLFGSIDSSPTSIDLGIMIHGDTPSHIWNDHTPLGWIYQRYPKSGSCL